MNVSGFVQGRDISYHTQDDIRPHNPHYMPFRSNIWYTDGSVIIQAERTQFRVHTSVLSRHSAVFSGVFALAPPPGIFEVDGCPVVFVTGFATDWEYILTALYDRYAYQSNLLPFPIVAAMQRLGKKYGFRSLHADAIRRLRKEFPTDLNDFQPYYTQIEVKDQSPIDAVNLMRETNFLASLPCALYCVCSGDIRVALEDIIRGEHRRGSAFLSQEDRDTCVIACTRLLRAQSDYTYAWLDTRRVPSPMCSSPDLCELARVHIRLEIWNTSAPLIVPINDWDCAWDEELCKECIVVGKFAHEAGRRELWRRLPSFFGLPSWEELERDSAF